MATEHKIGAYSAYAIAVRHGFVGTEEEWLESLRYDHSDEFGILAEQVQGNAESAAVSAQVAELSEQSAAQSANAAKQSAEQSAQAAADAGQIVKDAETAAIAAIDEAEATAVEAVGTAQTNAVQAVQDAGTEEAEKISSILPVPTEADAGKVPVAKPDGSGYELGEAGVQIDDTKTALDTTWSSENIVQKLCPPFEASESIVTCNPIEGSTLNTVVQIELVQEGTGDPSPENVRPIYGWDTVKLTYNEKEISIPLGQTVYGGTLDVGSGVLTVTYGIIKFSDISFTYQDGITMWGHPTFYGPISQKAIGNNFMVSSAYKYNNAYTDPSRLNLYEFMGFATNKTIYVHDNRYSTVEEFKEAMGDTKIAFMLESPTTVKLTSTEIRALSGVNTIYADAGDVTVSGYSDPTTIIKNLSDRIAALESAATDL